MHCNCASSRMSSRVIITILYSASNLYSICACSLQFVLGSSGKRRRTTQMFTSSSNRSAYFVGLSVSNGNNLVHRETFNGVQNEYLAVGPGSAIQSELDQSEHFVRVRSVVRSSCAAIRDHGFLGKGFVGVMDLQLRLVACPHTQLAHDLLYRHERQALR